MPVNKGKLGFLQNFSWIKSICSLTYNRSLVLVLVWCSFEILSRSFENCSKMNCEQWHFHLICRCLHGNSEYAHRFLNMILVTMACCLYYVKVNHTKKENSNFQKTWGQKSILSILALWQIWCNASKDADGMANSVDPGLSECSFRTLRAVWSGSTLFAQTCLSEQQHWAMILLVSLKQNIYWTEWVWKEEWISLHILILPNCWAHMYTCFI